MFWNTHCSLHTHTIFWWGVHFQVFTVFVDGCADVCRTIKKYTNLSKHINIAAIFCHYISLSVCLLLQNDGIRCGKWKKHCKQKVIRSYILIVSIFLDESHAVNRQTAKAKRRTNTHTLIGLFVCLRSGNKLVGVFMQSHHIRNEFAHSMLLFNYIFFVVLYLISFAMCNSRTIWLISLWDISFAFSLPDFDNHFLCQK